VAKRAAQMTLQDVGMKVRGLAASHCLDEVLEMVAAATPFFDFLALLVEGRGGGVTRHHHVAAFAMDDTADPGTHVRLGFQAADFEQQRRLLIGLINHLGVGGLAIVFIAQSSAEAEDLRSERRFAEEPTADVHLVDSLVAEVTVAGVPKIVPIIVQLRATQWRFRRRTAPQLVVHLFRHRLRAGGFPDRRTPLVA